MVDRDTICAVIGTRFYRSYNQGWTWEAPVTWSPDIFVGPGSLQMATDGTIVIADTKVRTSATGATGSWQEFGSGLSGNSLYAVPHPDWPENQLLYVCDATTGRVLRCQGSDGTFLDTGYTPSTANACLEMQFQNGMLYVITPYDVWRNAAPTAYISLMRTAWDDFSIGANSRADATAPSTGFGGTATTAVMHDNLILINGGDDGPPGTLGTLPANNLEDLWGLVDVGALGGPLIVSPSNGDEIPVDVTSGYAQPFTLQWSPLGQDQGRFTRWDIRVWDAADGAKAATLLTGVVPLDATAPAARSDNITGWPNLLAGHSYQWQVRGAATAAGANLTTPWSTAADFAVSQGTPVGPYYPGPQFIIPDKGGVTGINPGIVWEPIPGAESYQLVVATDPDFKHPVGGTPVELEQTSYLVTGLDYDTTYFCGVRVLLPSPSSMRITTFTTMSAPVTATTTPPSQIVLPEQSPPNVTVTVQSIPGGSTLPQGAVWAIVGIGGALVLAVIVLVAAVLVLILRTRPRY